MTARVVLAADAAEAVVAITARTDAVAVARRLHALGIMPEMGAVYDPEYDAARPGHEVRVTYAGHFGIYYTYRGEEGTVYVEAVLDERRDPLARFGG